MSNDIGGAVNMLKQLLADDKMKDTLTGLLGGILGGEDEDEPPADEEIQEEIAEEIKEEIEEETENAKLVLPRQNPENKLQNLLSTVDIQSLYSTLIGYEDKRIILLNALRPYLNRKRREKIDSAITIMQLVSISSSLGIDKLFGR